MQPSVQLLTLRSAQRETFRVSYPSFPRRRCPSIYSAEPVNRTRLAPSTTPSSSLSGLFSPSNLAFLDCFPASSSRQESIYSIVDVPGSETAPVSDPSSAQHPTTPPSATLRTHGYNHQSYGVQTRQKASYRITEQHAQALPSFLLSVTLVSGATIPVLSPAIF